MVLRSTSNGAQEHLEWCSGAPQTVLRSSSDGSNERPSLFRPNSHPDKHLRRRLVQASEDDGHDVATISAAASASSSRGLRMVAFTGNGS